MSLDFHHRDTETQSNAEGKYKAYPEYKDSGVEWVGNIPKTWTVKPLFGSSSSESVKNIKGAESNVLSLSYGNIIRRNVDKNFGLLPESFNTYQIVECGNLILRLTDLQNDKRSLRVGHVKERGIITSAYLKLVAKKELLDDNYLYRLLHSYDTTKVFYGMGGGLRQSMSFEDMRRLPVLLPSIEEQKQIAAFLDRETAKIDTLIDKQKKLIALLKEKRQATISHAVTKGLSPDAPMKDSGIPWLGNIPVHWEVKCLRYLGECQNGINIGAEFFGSGYPFLSYGDVYKNEILPKQASGLVQSTELDRKSYSVLEGDVLFTRTSETVEEIGLASTCLSTINHASFAGFLIRFRPIKNCLVANFSKYYFRSELLRTFFVKEMNLVTRASLSQDLLKKLPVPLPSIKEQKQIAEFLDDKTTKIDQLISKAEQAIELIQERRTALISAAVTGKVDVRLEG